MATYDPVERVVLWKVCLCVCVFVCALCVGVFVCALCVGVLCIVWVCLCGYIDPLC